MNWNARSKRIAFGNQEGLSQDGDFHQLFIRTKEFGHKWRARVCHGMNPLLCKLKHRVRQGNEKQDCAVFNAPLGKELRSEMLWVYGRLDALAVRWRGFRRPREN